MKKAIPVPLLLLAAAISSARPPENIRETLAAYIKGSPGGIAAAWVEPDGTQTLWGEGTVSADDPRRVTGDTVFEVGDVDEVFTALLLVQSERLGKASRFDPVGGYLLPHGDPARAPLARITLLSLATGTAGLPQGPLNFSIAGDKPDPSGGKLVTALRLEGPRAQPSPMAAPSELGAAVLRDALGAAWNSNYADALETQVLTPLGLRETRFGAGTLRSSSKDMAAFLAALLAKPGRPLGSALDETFQPQYPTWDRMGYVGLGWLLTTEGNDAVAWREGVTGSSHAFVAFRRATGQGIVILSNVRKDLEALGFGLLGVNPPQMRDVVPNATDYLGRYQDHPGDPNELPFFMDIVESKGAIFMKDNGGIRLQQMKETSLDHFSTGNGWQDWVFERNPAGKVTVLVSRVYRAPDQRYTRVESPQGPGEVELPIETLREYAGTYSLVAISDTAIKVTFIEEDGELIFKAFGGRTLDHQIFASAKDKYFEKADGGVAIEFLRDASGKVIGYTDPSNHNVRFRKLQP